MERSARCPTCNTAEWEWEADPGAYVAAQYTCKGCAQMDAFRSSLPKDQSQPPGSSVRLIPGATMRRVAGQPRKRPKSPREKKMEREAAGK